MNTLDERLINQLCAELDALTADVSAVPPPLVSSVGVARVVSIAPRRVRRRLVVLAAAIVAVIVGIAGLVAVRRDNRATGSTESSPDGVPVVTLPSAPGPVHPIPPSPEGWDFVEWGNVRLSLPAEMSPFRPDNGCVSTPRESDLEIVCGDQSVRIVAGPPDAVTDQIVNGLHVSWRAGECSGCQTLVLPELASTVSVQRHDDAAANSILSTVGPSGSWRYGYEIRPTPPAEWKTVTFEGVAIRVPPDWPVETVGASELGPCPQAMFANTVLLDLGLPNACDTPPVVAPTDGVRLYLAKPPLDTHPGWPGQLVAHGTSGDAPMVVMRVGYGVDPSVGLAILSSFGEASTDTTNSYSSVVPVDLPYFAIGESVMLGAKPNLEQRGITTIADVTQGPSWEVEQLQLAKTKYRITQGVVIQLGTNGTVTREEYEAVLAEVSDQNLVVVLTVKAPKPWIAGNNEIIRSLPETHPNVAVVDWEARSAEIADHLSQSDGGIHLTDDVSKAFYTNLILEALGLPTTTSPTKPEPSSTSLA
jgi:hypothetical protein